MPDEKSPLLSEDSSDGGSYLEVFGSYGEDSEPSENESEGESEGEYESFESNGETVILSEPEARSESGIP